MLYLNPNAEAYLMVLRIISILVMLGGYFLIIFLLVRFRLRRHAYLATIVYILIAFLAMAIYLYPFGLRDSFAAVEADPTIVTSPWLMAVGRSIKAAVSSFTFDLSIMEEPNAGDVAFYALGVAFAWFSISYALIEISVHTAFGSTKNAAWWRKKDYYIFTDLPFTEVKDFIKHLQNDRKAAITWVTDRQDQYLEDFQFLKNQIGSLDIHCRVAHLDENFFMFLEKNRPCWPWMKNRDVKIYCIYEKDEDNLRVATMINNYVSSRLHRGFLKKKRAFDELQADITAFFAKINEYNQANRVDLPKGGVSFLHKIERLQKEAYQLNFELWHTIDLKPMCAKSKVKPSLEKTKEGAEKKEAKTEAEKKEATAQKKEDNAINKYPFKIKELQPYHWRHQDLLTLARKYEAMDRLVYKAYREYKDRIDIAAISKPLHHFLKNHGAGNYFLLWEVRDPFAMRDEFSHGFYEAAQAINIAIENSDRVKLIDPPKKGFFLPYLEKLGKNDPNLLASYESIRKAYEKAKSIWAKTVDSSNYETITHFHRPVAPYFRVRRDKRAETEGHYKDLLAAYADLRGQCKQAIDYISEKAAEKEAIKHIVAYYVHDLSFATANDIAIHRAMPTLIAYLTRPLHLPSEKKEAMDALLKRVALKGWEEDTLAKAKDMGYDPVDVTCAVVTRALGKAYFEVAPSDLVRIEAKDALIDEMKAGLKKALSSKDIELSDPLSDSDWTLEDFVDEFAVRLFTEGVYYIPNDREEKEALREQAQAKKQKIIDEALGDSAKEIAAVDYSFKDPESLSFFYAKWILDPGNQRPDPRFDLDEATKVWWNWDKLSEDSKNRLLSNEVLKYYIAKQYGENDFFKKLGLREFEASISYQNRNIIDEMDVEQTCFGNITFFNEYNNVAQRFVYRHPITQFMSKKDFDEFRKIAQYAENSGSGATPLSPQQIIANMDPIHFCFFGFGHMNQEMFRLMSSSYQLPGDFPFKEVGGAKKRVIDYRAYTLPTGTPEEMHDAYFSKMPGLKNLPLFDLEFHGAELDNDAVLTEIAQGFVDEMDAYWKKGKHYPESLSVVVSLGHSMENMEIALRFRQIFLRLAMPKLLKADLPVEEEAKGKKGLRKLMNIYVYIKGDNTFAELEQGHVVDDRRSRSVFEASNDENKDIRDYLAKLNSDAGDYFAPFVPVIVFGRGGRFWDEEGDPLWQVATGLNSVYSFFPEIDYDNIETNNRDSHELAPAPTSRAATKESFYNESPKTILQNFAAVLSLPAKLALLGYRLDELKEGRMQEYGSDEVKIRDDLKGKMSDPVHLTWYEYPPESDIIAKSIHPANRPLCGYLIGQMEHNRWAAYQLSNGAIPFDDEDMAKLNPNFGPNTGLVTREKKTFTEYAGHVCLRSNSDMTKLQIELAKRRAALGGAVGDHPSKGQISDFKLTYWNDTIAITYLFEILQTVRHGDKDDGSLILTVVPIEKGEEAEEEFGK